MANEFIIKINKDSKGNNVSLTNMPVEAADALNAFINSLSKFVKSQNDSDFKISLQDGCIATSLVYSNNEINVDNEIDDVIDGKSSNLDYYDYLSILKHSCIGQKDALSLIDIYSAQEYDEYKSFFEKVENNKELERFDIVYNRILEIIKNEETNYNLLKTIKLYLNSQAEIGIIRTILLLIKPLKNDDNEINEVYQQLVTIIKEHY